MRFSACEVIFENTPIPVENVLGEVGGGFKVRNRCCLAV
jgi:acyl-CoA dehydrogenase family protein 9